MNTLNQQDINIIGIIYCFAFYVLGIVVYVLPKEEIKSSLFSRLWLIALFGILHGSYELMEWVLFNHQLNILGLQWIAAILLFVSYLPLTEFGRYTFYNKTNKLIWSVPVFYGFISIAALLAVLGRLIDHSLIDSVKSMTQVFMGETGALLTAFVLLDYSRNESYSTIKYYLLMAGLGFMYFGITTVILPHSSSQFAIALANKQSYSSIPAALLIRIFCLAVVIASMIYIVRRSLLTGRQNELNALDELKQLNESVELRIQERTHALEQQTCQLEQNISEHKKIEAALRASETKHKAIFDAEPDAMLISNEQGIIVMANQQAEYLLAYKTEELIGQTIEMLIPKAYRARHIKHRSDYAAAPYTRLMGIGMSGILALRKDQTVVDVEISLSPIQTEQGFLFASALRDITQRKQAEAKLRNSEERFRLMADSSPIMIWITDKNGKPTFANKAWLEFVGKDLEQSMSHEAWRAAVHPEDMESAFKEYYQDANAHEPITTEYRLRHEDGSWRWVFDQGMPMFNEEHEFVGYIGSLIDITERKQIENSLRVSEQRLALATQAGGIGIWDRDLQNNILLWDDLMFELYHLDAENFTDTYEAWQSCIHPDDVARVNTNIQAAIKGEQRLNTDFRIVWSNGEIRYIKATAEVLRDEQHNPLRMVGINRDITERRQIEIDLRIAAIAFESHEPMVITDANGIILKINSAFAESTGFSEQDALGQKISILKSGRHDTAFYKAMWKSINTTGSWQGEVWDRRKNGEIYPKWLCITAVKGNDGIVSHYVGTHADITEIKKAEDERKAHEQKIRDLAYFDPLTNLPNRRLLRDRIEHCLSSAARERKEMALLMLDLDRFKSVNDSLGHLAGDELLIQVAKRLKLRLRASDTAARLGGDEFVVLLEQISAPEDAARVAEAIIADLSKPFRLGENNDVWIGVSIGISLSPEHGDTPEMLTERADAALYQAKANGRGCYAYFSEALTQAARERIDLESRLRLALDREELCVFYQAQIDIASGRIIGAEALMRWFPSGQEEIPPDVFIPVAEVSGLILRLGEWVLREVCRQGRLWLDADLPAINLAVNVSRQQFRRIDLNALIAQVLVESGFPAGQLELEITESGLMEYQDKTGAMEFQDKLNENSFINKATETLNNLRSQGIRLAIDDFGTGYSSLAYLKLFPLDMLKIDKSFIAEIPRNQDDMEIAASIIAMGHKLGFKVLAEGVETVEQLEFLKAQGCDSFQGYLKSKPLPADEFAALLRGQM